MFQPGTLRYYHLLLVLLVSFLGIGAASGQLTADFTADKQGGCPGGLEVSFTNTTKGASAAATYKWDFGNKRTGTAKDGKTTYIDVGAYSITLTVTDGTASSSKTTTITVYKLPSIDFSSPTTKGCTPLAVNFTANAVAYDGATITSYLWDFGDGVTQSTTTNTASHTYTGARTPAVLVTVKDNHGCVNTSAVKSDIQVLPAVNALFTSDKTVLCATSEQIKLTSQSTGPGTLSYKWDFGDNASSTDQNPSHSYGAKGEYKVKLTVSSSEGCTASYELPKPVNVANFSVDFSVPPLLCTGTYSEFRATTNPATPDLITWTFGDGSSGYYNVTGKTYYTAGDYDVVLTARYGSCNTTATQKINVKKSPDLKGFIIENNGVCGAPATVSFKDTSSAAVKWNWSINGAASSSTSYTFTSNGGYGITLNITDAAGCTASRQKSIELRETYGIISALSSTSPYVLRGCEKFTVKFSATSSEKIDTYSWDFGDGGMATSEQPTHEFNKPGIHNVVLSFITEAGCKGKAYTTVTVYKKPTATFSMLNTNPVCGNTPVVFNATSLVTVDSWFWNFEGETSPLISRGPNPAYQYLKEGTYTVRLITDNGNGVCRDTVLKKDYVKVIPPFPKVNQPQNTCTGMRNKVTFTESSKQATEWRWDFGDGKSTVYASFQPTISHEYEKTGSYKVVLTAVNGPCAVKDSIIAYVMLKQEPVLTVSKPEICGHDNVQFTVTNPENNPYPLIGTQFYVTNIQYDKAGTPFTGSGGSSGYTYSNVYTGTLSGLTPGKDSIRAITTTGYFSCRDTTSFVKLHIKGPIAAYKVTANNVCFNTPNKFLEQSTLPDKVPIALWTWTYGDGKTESYTKGPEATHIYALPGTYYPSLKVTDKDGCYNTATTYSPNAPTAIVTGPRANFDWSPAAVKPGNTVYFNNITTYNNYTNTKYTWSFSYDGSTSTLQNPSKKYDKIAVDEVKLVARDISSGCVDSITKKVSINNIHAAFSYNVTYIRTNNCAPALVRYTNSSTDFNKVRWDFGNGNSADNINAPNNTYEKPGKYIVKLYAYDDKGGVDSTEQVITINGPSGTFVVDVAQTCGVPAAIHFTASTQNATDFTWDFGNGVTADSKNYDTTYTYTLPGAYYPTIIVKDGLGCSFPFPLDQPFVIDTMRIRFSKTPAVICDSALVNFTPAVVNIGADELNLPVTYHWDFGTGNPDDTSNAAYPAFKYKGLGGEQFKAHLTVQSYAGCVEEAEELVTIVRTTKGAITAVPEICQFEEVSFKGAADGPVRSWRWELAGKAAVVTGKTEVAQQYNKGGDYKELLIIENEGCIDTAIHLLTVHTLPDVALPAKNVLLCLGDSAVLEAHNGVHYQWIPATTITDATAAAPKVFPVVNTKYKVIVTDQYSCVNKDSVQVTLSYPFTIVANADTVVCKGDIVPFQATGAVSYKWTKGSHLSNPGIPNPSVNATISSTYEVVGYGKDACFTDTASFTMTVQPMPSIKTIADTMLIAGFELPLKTVGTSDINKYTWTPGLYLDCSNCSTPIAMPKRSISYVVTASNQYGCTAKDTVAITLRCAESTVFIPNSFTPNKDSRNDLFYPRGKGIRLVKSFRIYNRLGELIFERHNFMINDAANGWDGSYLGKPLTSSVFTYTSEMICDAGDLYLMKGPVMLIR